MYVVCVCHRHLWKQTNRSRCSPGWQAGIKLPSCHRRQDWAQTQRALPAPASRALGLKTWVPHCLASPSLFFLLVFIHLSRCLKPGNLLALPLWLHLPLLIMTHVNANAVPSLHWAKFCRKGQHLLLHPTHSARLLSQAPWSKVWSREWVLMFRVQLHLRPIETSQESSLLPIRSRKEGREETAELDFCAPHAVPKRIVPAASQPSTSVLDKLQKLYT